MGTLLLALAGAPGFALPAEAQEFDRSPSSDLGATVTAAPGLRPTAYVGGGYPTGVWSAPVNLGPPVSTAMVEQTPAISQDGLTLYFFCSRPLSAGGGSCPGGLGGIDIWFSQRVSVDDPWGPPQNLGPTINTAYDELFPELSRDGHELYFASNRPGGYGGSDLYVSRRSNKHDDLGWQTPVNLGAGVNTNANERGPAPFDHGVKKTTLYFHSDRTGGPGGNDIYAATLQRGKTFGPAVLVPELSTLFTDQGVSIRGDGLELFLSSNRPGTLGSNDLWISVRSSTRAPWSTPVNLGAGVNGAFTEAGPEISDDGTALYFHSDRPGSLSFDLWVTTRSGTPSPGP